MCAANRFVLPASVVWVGLMTLCASHAARAGVSEPPEIGPLVDPGALSLPADAVVEDVAPEPVPAPAQAADSAPQAASDRDGDLFAAHYGVASEEERTLIEHAVHHCDNAAARHAKPFWMLELLRVEREMDIPEELRGVLLAAWCGEAAYQLGAVVGDEGRAVGILQLHSHITRLCGDPDLRNDPVASAQCWMWNLNRVHRKAARRCKPKDAWKAAELWLSQGGKKSGYSCRGRSGHVARLERWQRNIERSRRVAMMSVMR